MKLLTAASRPAAAILLAGFSGVALSAVTVEAEKAAVVIVVHSNGTYSVYGGDGKEIQESCILCELVDKETGEPNNVQSCRALYEKKKVCLGTVDTTMQWVRGLSVIFTRTTKSPDVCYKEVCMGGSCKNYPYNC
jgi:hypothetical protein